MTRARALVLSLAAAMLVTGCLRSGDDASTVERSSAPTPTISSSHATTPPTETAFAGTEIEVAVVDGKVTPPTHRVKVDEGTQVRLLVTSDTADEVHIHGFDIEQDLPAGEQATIDFTADQTGLFEIETHESGLQLVQLEVR